MGRKTRYKFLVFIRHTRLRINRLLLSCMCVHVVCFSWNDSIVRVSMLSISLLHCSSDLILNRHQQRVDILEPLKIRLAYRRQQMWRIRRQPRRLIGELWVKIFKPEIVTDEGFVWLLKIKFLNFQMNFWNRCNSYFSHVSLPGYITPKILS